jgi:glycosyltransferase involved in cell wall biosynthesis
VVTSLRRSSTPANAAEGNIVPGELVVVSHLRWDFVWQRPQHLISRLASRAERTWFVEEPRAVPGARHTTLRSERHGAVTRLWLEVPGDAPHLGFDDVGDACEERVARHLGTASDRVVWLYTPMALPLADRLEPQLLVFDVMDDLASFAHASPLLRSRHADALERADIVFTGGRSLQRLVVGTRSDAHCFPSGVEPEHYARARHYRTPRLRPTAGYVGVIDERLDLELVAETARALPDWEIYMVGPVVKIDAAALPVAPNLHYPGSRPYEELPRVLGGFDVALMPFALNEATRSISPTKTLEYLAAGLPVVSTRVPDVVSDFGEVVALCDDGASFAAACRRAITESAEARERKVRPLLNWNHWDTIANRMGVLLDGARTVRGTERTA